MSAARPGQWSLVWTEDNDPAPGDPGTMRTGANTYIETGHAIATAKTNLNNVADDQRSKTVDKIRDQARTIADQLGKAESRCTDGGRALNTYAQALDEARRSTKRALDDATAAHEDQKNAIKAQNEAAQSYNATNDDVARDGHRTVYYQRQADAQAAAARVAAARQACLAAMDVLQAAARVAAEALGTIQKASQLNDTVLDQIKEVLKKVKDWIDKVVKVIKAALQALIAIVLVCLLVDLVALFLPPFFLPSLALLVVGVLVVGASVTEARRRMDERYPKDADVTEPTKNLRVRTDPPSGDGGELKDVPDIIDRIQDMDEDDGLRLEKIKCADGQERYILYIGGTRAASGRYGDSMTDAENINSYLGADTATDQRIQRFLADRVKPPNAEIMVAGYSQGGLHALSLVDSGKFNVTQVVTVFAPDRVTPIDTHGANIVNIKDTNDTVGKIPGGSDVNGADFIGSSRSPKMEFPGGSHTDFNAMRDVAEQWENSWDGKTLESRLGVNKFLNGKTLATYD